MKPKEIQIKEKLAEPIKVGDKVDINIKYQVEIPAVIKKNKIVKEVEIKNEEWSDSGEVIEILEGGMFYAINRTNSKTLPYNLEIREVNAKYGYEYKHNIDVFKSEYVSQDTDKCGANPFKENIPRVDFWNQSIWQILFNAGYGKINDIYSDKQDVKVINGNSPGDKEYIGCTYGGMNFDPYVIDKDGNKQYFQRGLVWTLEQKQLLIESIYNGIEIGKFVVRYHSWKNLQNQMKETGHGFNFDCVDGKQRYNAIIEFVINKIPDLRGNYYKDLSLSAQRKFMDYSKLSFGKMDENTTDADTVAVFLTLNFTGTPMSKEHIEYVQKIKI